MEKTIIIIKPPIPFEEYKTEVITSREKFIKIFERIIKIKGFSIEEKKEEIIDRDTAENHYGDKKDHPLFNSVVKYITSEVSTILSINGESAISEVRKIALDMRKKYIGNGSKLYNLIHSSDSIYESDREHKIHFPK